MKNDITQTLQGLNVSVARFAREMGLTRQAFRSRYTRKCGVDLQKELIAALDKHIMACMIYRDLLTEKAYQQLVDEAQQNAGAVGKVVDARSKREIKQ